MSTTPYRTACFTPGTLHQTGWNHIDQALITERMHILKELGHTHLLLRPPWHWLQPRPQRIATTAINILERILDAADKHQLQTIVSLLDVDTYGVISVPDWHNAPDVIGWMQKRTTQPVRTEGRTALINGQRRRLRMANPYRTPELVAAHRFIITTVMGYFAGHPAANHWMLAHGWSRLADDQPAVVRTWLQQLCEHARMAHPRATLLGSVDYPSLTTHALRLPLLESQFDMLVGTSVWPELATPQQRPLSAPTRFISMLIGGLTTKPHLMWMPPIAQSLTATSQWQSIPWHQLQWQLPLLNQSDQQRFCEALYAGLRPNQVHGTILTAPFGAVPTSDEHDLAWWEWLAPLVTNGNAAVIAEHNQAWQQVGTTASVIDSERYWYAPHQECQRMWHDFG